MADNIPTLDLSKVLNGGLMGDLGAVMEQGTLGFTFPPPGIVIAEHLYIPLIPPLPILPVVMFP